MFGMTHQKSVLLVPLVVAAIFYFLHNSKAVLYIIVGFITVAGLSIIEILLIAASEQESVATYTSIVIRRMFFAPALIDSIYVNFFVDAPKLMWSTSRFGFGLAQNPYDVTAPFLIGRDVFGNEGMSANTGVIGSGFSHAGMTGVIRPKCGNFDHIDAC